jgi:hypothetical protein
MTEHCCDDMRAALAEDDLSIIFNSVFREYGIEYTDGGTSYRLIARCPWCGIQLPESLRDAWFDELETLGLDPDDPNLPSRFRTSAWWDEKDHDVV